MSRKRGKSRITRPEPSDFTPLPPEEEARLRAEAEAYAASDAQYESFAEPDEVEEPLGPPPDIEEALFALQAWEDPAKAAQAAAHHRAERRYLGVPVPAIEDMVTLWRAQLDVPGRVELAAQLWDSDIHEARIAAAKLLTQARLRPDTEAWALITSWVPQFDALALADHACKAGAKRLEADPARLDLIEEWIGSSHMWTRRAAFVITLPFTKARTPKPEESAARERILGWATARADDPHGFVQSAIGGWLHALSKKDPERVRIWLAQEGERLKPFAREEAAKAL